MEDTAAKPANLIAIDAMAEPDYLTVINDTGEPDYIAVIDDTGAPEYAAAVDDAARNPAYHETVGNTSESTHANVRGLFVFNSIWLNH
jgi:hypothetical protein